jgi:outer membrane lipoprotein carrier protein
MRTLVLSSILAVLTATPTVASETAATAPPHFSASSSSFVYTSTAALTVEGILAHMERMDSLLHSLSARYSQEMSVPDTGMRSSVHGRLQFRKPERLRIEHDRPERQTIVADGVDIWIHRHAHSQVIQSKLKDWKQADPTMSNLMQFGSYAKMLRTYDVRLASGTLPALLLYPKKKSRDGDFHLKLGLDRNTLFPSHVRLTVGAMTILTQFSEVAFNPDLQEKAFTFTPPKGADVFRNFKPPRMQ